MDYVSDVGWGAGNMMGFSGGGIMMVTFGFCSLFLLFGWCVKSVVKIYILNQVRMLLKF